MKIEEWQRNSAAAILILVVAISIIYQYPMLLGFDNALLGNNQIDNDLEPGQIAFTKNTDTGRTGDVGTFIYPITDEEHVIITRTIIDTRIEDEVEEYRIRTPSGEDTLWISHQNLESTAVITIPVVGQLIYLLRTVPGLLFLVAAPLFIISLYEVQKIQRELNKDKSEYNKTEDYYEI